MRKIILSMLFGAGAAAGAVAAPCASATPDFQAPAGWTRTDIPTPTPNRTIARFQVAGDTATSITFVADPSVSYEQTLAAMKKNFTDNAIRLAVDRDVSCRNAKGHVVEFTSGPDGVRTIFNRLVVPIGAGVAMITYTRIEGNAFDDDVRKAEQTFCAQPSAEPAQPSIVPATAPAPAAT